MPYNVFPAFTLTDLVKTLLSASKQCPTKVSTVLYFTNKDEIILMAFISGIRVTPSSLFFLSSFQQLLPVTTVLMALKECSVSKQCPTEVSTALYFTNKDEIITIAFISEI